MRNRKTLIGFALIVAVLVLGVGYAIISNVNPTISGTAEMATTDLKVVFTGATSMTDAGCTGCENVTVDTDAVADGLTATIEVAGLERVGNSVTATYTLQNKETDIAANITQGTITVSQSEYFQVTTDVGSGFVMQPGATHDVTITVSVIKTPILEANSTTEITVPLTAAPVTTP